MIETTWAKLAIDVAPWRRLTKVERTAIDGETARSVPSWALRPT